MLKEDKENGLVVFDAQISSVRTLRDKSASITLHLQEIPKGRGGTLMDLNQEHVAVMIKPFAESFSLEEAKEVVEFEPGKYDIDTQKSPSKRLRNVIWKRWEVNGKEGDWELFYMKIMENLISDQKEYLI